MSDFDLEAWRNMIEGSNLTGNDAVITTAGDVQDIIAEVERLRKLNNDLSQILSRQSGVLQASARQIAREAWKAGYQAHENGAHRLDNPHLEDQP